MAKTDDPTGDDDGEAGQDGSSCPFCATRDCADHLLACFDLTFPGQGELGAGLGAGALYDHVGLAELFEALNLAKVEAWAEGGRDADAPIWIATRPDLLAYFIALGDAGFAAEPGEAMEGAAFRIVEATNNHGSRVRALVESLAAEAGWGGSTSHDYDDVFLASSAYRLLWDENAPRLARKLQGTIEAFLPSKLSAGALGARPGEEIDRLAQGAQSTLPSAPDFPKPNAVSVTRKPGHDGGCDAKWIVEPPGAREAFERLRDAASDPSVPSSQFNIQAAHFFSLGLAPDQWKRPNDGRVYERGEVAIAVSRYGWGQIRALLNDGTPIPREPSGAADDEEEE